MRVMYRMCQQVEHLNKLVGIHFKLYKSNLSVWRESFVRSLPGEINFIFVTTGKAICSEEQTCDSCVMKSLILSRHPPPSSEKGCEPLFPDLHLCQFYILTVVVVDQRDDWRGNKTGENVQEGQTQHGWIKNVPEGGGSDWTAKLFVFLLDERHILGG